MSEEQVLSIGQALDLGHEMAVAGDHASAIGMFNGVLMHEPDNFEAIERLGSVLFETKRYHEALYWFWRGRKINRRHPLALTNYGLCLAQLGHADEGVADLQRAAAIAEKNPATSPAVRAMIYNNLGNTLERLKRYPEALLALDKGIATNPADHFPHYNRGIVLLRLNRHQEAIEALQRSIELNPDNASADGALHDAIYNRGMARLLLGDLKGGFEDYEHRLLTTENKRLNLGMPAELKLQAGTSVLGKRILVVCEQGLGDDIQFFRYLRALLDRCAFVSVLAAGHEPTMALIEHLPLNIIRSGDTPPVYDHWVALMSLPHVLGLYDDIPAPFAVPFDRPRWEHWGEALRPSLGKLNVGICWAGNFRHKNDSHRSIAFETFLKAIPQDCNVISLQQVREEDIDAVKAKAGAGFQAIDLQSFQDTAAVIRHLDCVVTVDTSVAHLAASLGVPTLVLIPAFATDWRWQLNRSDSPWYPSAELIRQHKVGDWSEALAKLKRALEDRSAVLANTLAAAS